MRNGFCSTRFFGSIEGDVPMKGDVIYYSQNSAVGSIVKMMDAIIVDEFIILYVGTSKGHIGKVSNASWYKFYHDTISEIIAFYVVISINFRSQSNFTNDTLR
jgi:hypothetical protein